MRDGTLSVQLPPCRQRWKCGIAVLLQIMHPFYLSHTRLCLCNALHFRLVCAQLSYCLRVILSGFWVGGAVLDFLHDGGEPFSVICNLAPGCGFPSLFWGCWRWAGVCRLRGAPHSPHSQGRVSPQCRQQWSQAQLWEPAEGKAASCSSFPFSLFVFSWMHRGSCLSSVHRGVAIKAITC